MPPQSPFPDSTRATALALMGQYGEDAAVMAVMRAAELAAQGDVGGLAQWDESSDHVSLQRQTFVATGDLSRQLGFLGDNVGDHLRAAVENVLGGEDRLHFEQALFADGLTAASIESVRPQVHAQWQALLAALVPALEARVAADATQQPAPQGRLRVGLYTYHEGAAAVAPALESARPRARAQRKK